MNTTGAAAYSQGWYVSGPASVVCCRGVESRDLLNRLSTQDLTTLRTPGDRSSTLFVTERGKLVDWTEALMVSADEVWLVTSPGRAPALATWISRFIVMENVTATALEAGWSRLTVQRASASAQALRPAWREGRGWGWPGLAEFGWRDELLVPDEECAVLEARLCAEGLRATDAAELERHRIVTGVPSPSYEFADGVLPLELRLRAAVSFRKGCYVGQEVIARVDSYDLVARLMVGLEGEGAPPTPGTKVWRGERAVGRVTSAISTAASAWAGLAVVSRDEAAAQAVTVGDGLGGAALARVVERPFARIQG